MLLKKSTILLTSAIFAGSAIAGESNTEKLEQVVVTATKTERPIDKVTASVQVITDKDIQKMGAITLKDVFKKTPGLVLQYGTFPSGSAVSKSSISIRGIGATGTLWLLDGRRLAGELKNPYDMDRIPASMIKRIEVVKGPMSALYGADAVGGVINIITKQPEKGFFADVSVSGGANSDGDGANKQLSANVRGGTGNFRGSFYASIADTDPYTESEQTDTRVGGGRHKPENGIPLIPGYLNPAGPTNGNPFYVQADGSVKPMPIDPAMLASDRLAAQVSFTNFRDQVSQNVKDSYDVGVTYRENSTVDTIGGRGEFDLTDKLTIGAEFNWFQEERNGVYRGMFHPMGFMPPIGHRTNPIISHDGNGAPIAQRRGAIPSYDVPVNSKDENERLDVAADIHYFVSDELDVNFRIYNSYYEKRNTTTISEFADFGFPSEAKSAASGMSANVDVMSYELSSNWQIMNNHLLTGGVEFRDEKREATVFSQSKDMDTRKVAYQALYLQNDFSVSDTLAFTVGGRYDRYTQLSYVDEFNVTHEEQVDSETTFRAGTLKNFTQLFNLRVNIAQGYRVPDMRELFIQKQTPAGMQLGAQTIDPRFGKQAYDLKAERTMSYEVGLSGNRDSFSYNAVVFHNDIKDKIEYIRISPTTTSPGYFTFENVNDATTQGTELTLGYDLTKNLQSQLFWTELRTENKDTGKDLEFNPDRVIAMALSWDPTDRFRTGIDATYTGKQFYLDNGTEKETDAYTLVNMTLGYRLGAKRQLDIFGGVNNIFDEEVDKRLGSNVGTFYFAGVRMSF